MVIWCSKSMLRLTLPRMISPARGRVQLFKLDHLFSITAPCLDMQETHSHLNNAEASVVPVVTAPHPCYSHTIIFFNSGRQSCLYWSRWWRGRGEEEVGGGEEDGMDERFKRGVRGAVISPFPAPSSPLHPLLKRAKILLCK